jgi:hypothetical protein
MSRRNVALFGATIVSVIYGITFTIKDVMPQYIDAGFIVTGTGHDFILAVLVVYAEGKIALNDFPRIIAAAFFAF